MQINQTIERQLQHTTIRSFKETPLTQEEISVLLDVAQQAPTSNFMQSYSIISITDHTIREALATIGTQPFIAENGHLFLFVVDQARNAKVGAELGYDPVVQGTSDRLVAGLMDVAIAAQNMVVAAESLGMGTVYLGSLLNDCPQLIELLRLPPLVFPAVGLIVGWPAQASQVKPRLPREIIHMENKYKPLRSLADLEKYNQQIKQYYDERQLNQRIDTYTKQVAKRMKPLSAKRDRIGRCLKEQGFLNEL